MTSIYTFTFTRLDGRPQALADWRGQVLLLVNVASHCGFAPQYAGLEMLWQRYRDAGLIVIGFPCDQFAGQEPGDEAKIAEFCTLTYGVDFPMAAKIKVNGADAHPLWQWLKHRRRGLFGVAAIKWNFTKFLIRTQRATHCPLFANQVTGAIGGAYRSCLRGGRGGNTH